MSSGFVWTVIGSVAGIAAVVVTLLQVVMPAVARRRTNRPVRARPHGWLGHRAPIANPRRRRSERFTGRGELLIELRAAMRGGPPVVLYGLGGVGKTEVALAFVEDQQRRYGVVWWVRAEQRVTLEADLVALARALRLPEHAAPNQELVVAAVRGWLVRHRDWLLVLDNARDDSALEQVWPAGAQGRVLVTSRNQLWRDGRVVWVRPWTPEESLAFLRASLTGEPTAQFDPADAAALAAELGHLPIALEQAVAFMRAASRPLADYLAMVRTRSQELFSLSDLPADERTVAKTWAAALGEVAATPGAAELLAVCAYLAPDDIPRELFHQGADELAEPLGGVAAGKVGLDAAVVTLRRFSFVDATEQALTVHRLVQAVVRHRLDEDGQREWAASAVRIINAAFPGNSGEVRTWPVCEPLLPHALAAAGHAEHLQVEPKVTGRLLNEVGVYLRGRARLVEARDVCERALAITEATLGPDHPDVAICRNNLGNVLQGLGDLPGARAQYERALAITEATLGPDHPDVAIRRNNLGNVLRDLGDLPGARAQYERALAITEATLGPDHPTVATCRKNLAAVQAVDQ